jgi:dolichol kinase
MKKSLLTETYRKAIHIGSLIIPLSYRFVFHSDRRTFFLFLVPITVIAFLIELFRLQNKTFKNIFYNIFGLIIRKHEHNDFTGATYLLMSSVLSIALFPADIAFLALSFLSIGDTLAAIVGKSVGKRKFQNKKSLEGTLACFVGTFIYALFFMPNPVIAFFGSLSTALAELAEIPIDDNIKIPLISGFVMLIISFFVS